MKHGPDNEKQLKLDEGSCEEILNHLDSRRQPVLGRDRRAFERHVCRDVFRVELFQANDVKITYAALMRNISESGASFVVGQFVHSGHNCKLHLVTPDGQWQTVSGTIVFCRYLAGSAHLYEVGMKFDERIKVGMFGKNSIPAGMRILFVDDDAFIRKVAQNLLKNIDIELIFAKTGKEAIEVAMSSVPDITFMDLDMPEVGGLDAVKELRSKGFSQKIIAITALEGNEIRTKCLKNGFDGFVKKPFSRTDILGHLSSKSKTLASSLARDADMIEIINEFVNELPNKVRELEAVFDKGDIDLLSGKIRSLKSQAGVCGFSPISDLAEKLGKQIQAEKDIVKVSAGIKEIVGLCRSAKPVVPSSEK